jgi:predicted RNA-binding Zn-ribbon protein involved in translation (DUF1610 family)
MRGISVYISETRQLIRRRGEPARSDPCPNCGRPMHLLLGGLAPGVLPEGRRYRCGECGVSVRDDSDD